MAVCLLERDISQVHHEAVAFLAESYPCKDAELLIGFFSWILLLCVESLIAIGEPWLVPGAITFGSGPRTGNGCIDGICGDQQVSVTWGGISTIGKQNLAGLVSNVGNLACSWSGNGRRLSGQREFNAQSLERLQRVKRE